MASENVIGIDLGTTHSCVAVWDKFWKRVEVIRNDQGNKTTPSCVAFTNEERLVGEPALNQAIRNPQNTIHEAKRIIGRRFFENTVQQNLKNYPFKVVCGTGNTSKIEVEWKRERQYFSPEEISSMVLVKMKEIAENNYLKGEKVTKAVITVPAYFNDTQRQATKNAGKIAGLDEVSIVNEPTAAALAYGLHESTKNRGKHTVLVFDLGGGTFDVSILQINGLHFNVLGTGGDTNLGGNDFDEALVKYFCQEFKEKHNQDLTNNPRSVRRLRKTCECAKIALSFQSQMYKLDIDNLYDNQDFESQLSRVALENILGDYFQKCIDAVDDTIKNAKLKKQNIDDVVLVGGSSRIPKIQQMLSEYFGGIQLQKNINPDEAVAYGAAVWGLIMQQQPEEVSEKTEVSQIKVQDVTPLSLGIGVAGSLVSVIVPRNTPVPCKIEKDFQNSRDFQSVVTIDIFQGERPLQQDNCFLDKFDFKITEPGLRGQNKIRVSFSIDHENILHVSVKEKYKDNVVEKQISGNKNTLNQSEIKQALQKAQKFRAEDEKERQRLQCRSNLEKALYEFKNSIRSKTSCQQFMEQVEQNEKWMRTNLHASLQELQDKLEKVDAWKKFVQDFP